MRLLPAQPIVDKSSSAVTDPLNQAQLLRFAEDLHDLMNQHRQLQQDHAKALELLKSDQLSREFLMNLALQDPLTGLPNRRGLEQRLTDAILSSESDDPTCVYVLYMDLDRFKPVNDTLGHDVGDHVLQEVGRRLQSVVRRNDTVARVGGDEFVVVLQRMEAQAIVIKIAESILSAIRTPIHVNEHTLVIGISIGCACHPNDGTDIENLLKRADAAMYQAKRYASGLVFYSELASGDEKPPASVNQD